MAEQCQRFSQQESGKDTQTGLCLKRGWTLLHSTLCGCPSSTSSRPTVCAWVWFEQRRHWSKPFRHPDYYNTTAVSVEMKWFGWTDLGAAMNADQENEPETLNFSLHLQAERRQQPLFPPPDWHKHSLSSPPAPLSERHFCYHICIKWNYMQKCT